MELRHLRYFLAVAEELHFTRAAARLHIGQPPLSQQIQALEAELGVSLFHRTRRSVRLTEAGEHLLVRAREILGASEAVAGELHRIAQGEAGELRIGFTSTGLLMNDLRAMIRRYRQHFPAVNLRLREMYTQAQFEALSQAELDIGFVRFNDAPPAGLLLHPLHRDRLCLVLPDEHPLASRDTVALAECQDEDFIFYPERSGASVAPLVRQLAVQAGIQLRIVQEAREALTQIGLVSAGMGVAVLPAPMAVMQIPGVRFIPLSDEGAHLDMGLACRADDPSPRVRGFLQMLDEQGRGGL